jgi:hypothetical protein
MNPYTGKVRKIGSNRVDNERDYGFDFECYPPESEMSNTVRKRWKALTTDFFFNELLPYAPRNQNAVRAKLAVGTKVILGQPVAQTGELDISPDLEVYDSVDNDIYVVMISPNNVKEDLTVVKIKDGLVVSRRISQKEGHEGALALARSRQVEGYDPTIELEYRPSIGDLVYVMWEDQQWYETVVTEIDLKDISVKLKNESVGTRDGFRVVFAGGVEYHDVPYDCRNTEDRWLLAENIPLEKNHRDYELQSNPIDLANMYPPLVVAGYTQDEGRTYHEMGRIEQLILDGQVDLQSMKVAPVSSIDVKRPYSNKTGKELSAAMQEDAQMLKQVNGKPVEPRTKRELEALSTEDQKVWNRSLMMEYFGLLDTGTFEPVLKSAEQIRYEGRKKENPPKFLPSFVVRKVKTENGVITKAKSRCVACGNFDNTPYSSRDIQSFVAGFDEIKLFVSEAVRKRAKLKSADIQQAFLQADIDDKVDIYIKPPKELEAIIGQGTLLKLKKSLYGLSRAPKLWADCLSKGLRGIGLEPLKSDPTVFKGKVKGKEDCKPIHVLTYVDDLLYYSEDDNVTAAFEEALGKRFPVSFSDGPVTHFCGVTFEWETDDDGTPNGSLFMHQESYVEACLDSAFAESRKVWNMKEKGFNTRGYSTPSGWHDSDGLPLENKDLAKDDKYVDLLRAQKMPSTSRYREVLGMAGWLANRTRPEIQYVVQRLAKHSNYAGTVHMYAMEELWYYLWSTTKLGIGFHPDPDANGNLPATKLSGAWNSFGWPRICLATDADLGGLKFDKATVGRILYVAGGPVSCHIGDSFVALSTAESELGAIALGIYDADWCDVFLKDLTETGLKRPIRSFTDNQTTIHYSRSGGSKCKTRHLALRGNKVRLAVQEEQIELVHTSTDANPSDLLTKDHKRNAHTVTNFHKLREAMLGMSRKQCLRHWKHLAGEISTTNDGRQVPTNHHGQIPWSEEVYDDDFVLWKQGSALPFSVPMSGLNAILWRAFH